MAELLELKNLSVTYRSPRGPVQAVRGVDLTLRPGEVLAIVGESGCGKSALCKAILHLLPDEAQAGGEILLHGTDIAPYREREMRRLRGSVFSMVFQDPMTALNPSMTIGAQIAEAVRVHAPEASRAAVRARVLELMALDFAIDELGLYLVTHAEDQEVLQLYWSYIKMAKDGREKYQKMYGPLLQTDLTPEDGYAWLKDPWPWELGGND